MSHQGPVAVLGEIVAGTDEADAVIPGHASGAKTNRLAFFAEADYAPLRSRLINFLEVRAHERIPYVAPSAPRMSSAAI